MSMGSRKANTEGIDEELLIASIGRRQQDGTLYRAQEPSTPAPAEESVPETEQPPIIIRKTKCSCVLERNVPERKTKRSFSENFSTGFAGFKSLLKRRWKTIPTPFFRFVASLPL